LICRYALHRLFRDTAHCAAAYSRFAAPPLLNRYASMPLDSTVAAVNRGGGAGRDKRTVAR
jgi:hypothetical protein